MSSLPEPDPSLPSSLNEWELQVVSVFVDIVRVIGLPRSIGEIYGLLFITSRPLALDDLVEKLEMSKGSGSQGIRALKQLGAIREVHLPGERRTYYEPAVELKRLVGGFIREQVRPHVDSGKAKIGKLYESVAHEADPERREFLEERIGKLRSWMKRGGLMLPMLQKMLGE